MKILLINTVEFKINGMSTVIMNYYRNIKDERISFDFVVNQRIENIYLQEIKERGDKVFILKNRKKKLLSYFKNLRRIIRDNHYDIVHVHGNSALMLIELIAAKADSNAITVVHSHNTNCTYKKLNNLLHNKFIDSYDYAVACSNDAGKWLYKDNPYIVINNGINEKKFLYSENNREKYRRINGYNDNQFIILHVGLFNEQKNQSFLIDIFKCIAEKDDSAVLRLVGKGWKLNEIIEKVSKLNLNDRVCFAGVTDNPEIEYNMADVFVFPSLFEGFGLVTIEAQCAGLPCVLSSNVPEKVKITDNVDFLDLNDKVETWAETILKYKNLECRRSHNHDVIKNNFSIESEAEKLIDFYKKIYKKGK